MAGRNPCAKGACRNGSAVEAPTSEIIYFPLFADIAKVEITLNEELAKDMKP
jgi:hypothetical protein